MAIKKHVNGDIIEANETNEDNAIAYRAALLNTIRQLKDRAIDLSADGGEWAEAYTDSNGRLNSVDTGSCSAPFDVDKYKAFSENSYIVIEATSLTESDFSINDCVCKNVEAGKWFLYCTTGSTEIKRAQIYKTLFYGTDGTNARASNTYITGITALKTSISRDIGKRGVYIKTTTGPNLSGSYTLTMDNTSTNTDFSSWSKLYGSDGSTSDEIGTDRTADEQDNPATCIIYSEGSNVGEAKWTVGGTQVNHVGTGNVDPTMTSYIMMLVKDSYSGVLSGSMVLQTETDFLTDNGIPLLTASDAITSVITHDLPVTTEVGGAIVFEDLSTHTTTSGTYVNIINETGLSTSVGGVTFDIKTDYSVYKARAEITFTYSDASTEVLEALQTTTGTTWQSFELLNPEFTKTVTGIAVDLKISTGGSARYASFTNFVVNGDLIITSYFSSTISSSVGTALVANWEAGSGIQYKLLNATEDTGWLDYNALSEFTAFTSVPTQCIVKLTPKTTIPTSGYPAIYGFGVKEK